MAVSWTLLTIQNRLPAFRGPQISNVNPPMTQEGAQALTLQVEGPIFNPKSVVRFDTYRIASSRFVAGNPWRILLVFGTGATVLSSVLSNTVTTMIFMSIALGLAGTLRLQRVAAIQCNGFRQRLCTHRYDDQRGGTVLGLLSTPAVALIGYYGASLILP